MEGSLLDRAREALRRGARRKMVVARDAGDAARARGAWAEALLHYDMGIALRPGSYGLRMRRAHTLKELGRLDEAEAAYRSALPSSSDPAEVWINLGHVLKLKGAVSAATSCYQKALDIGDERARVELLGLSGRAALSDAGDRTRLRSVIADVAADVSDLRDRMDEALQQSAFSPFAYSQFRHRLTGGLPSRGGSLAESVHVIVDARSATPAEILLTLHSLQDQVSVPWTAEVLSDDEIAAHPVGSWGEHDARIRFRSSTESSVPALGRIALLPAGAKLEPNALSWLSYGLSRSKADVAYGDHDYSVHDWRGMSDFSDPVFYGAFDEIGLDSGEEPPLLILLSEGRHDVVNSAISNNVSGRELQRHILLNLGEAAFAHVPRLLSTFCGFYNQANRWTPMDVAGTPKGNQDQSICVVIPTRDQHELLNVALNSLIRKARNPNALRIVVVDNRSSTAEAASLFRHLQQAGIELIEADEPFNWARMNNRAVLGRSEDIFIFMNNDMEVVADAWDDRVRESVAIAQGGCVGAKLLYPDGRVQHAGVLLGARNGSPIHDGLDAGANDPGPGGRWARRRRCAAVTGAFLAVSRTAFLQAQGFDERFAVGYSDLDFCLRCRRAGYPVVYDPFIRLIHFESKTRGLNSTTEKTSWDDVEMELFYQTWKLDALSDPSRSPHWVTENRNAYDGVRLPSDREVIEHILRYSRRAAWRVD